MKVKELIEQLQQFDYTLDVNIADSCGLFHLYQITEQILYKNPKGDLSWDKTDDCEEVKFIILG